MNKFLSRETTEELLQNIINSGHPYIYDFTRHRIILQDKTGTDLVYLRLPIVVSCLPSSAESIHYIILLIQSGSCAMGYFEDGENIDHKVYRSYMVRKKQGKSQVKYLKTKGKSRAGSRVRLGETIEFFENINGRLQEYFEDYSVDRIAMSCSKILIPYLFNSKVATPFNKNDARIYRIPKHVHLPILDVMNNVNKFLLKGELIYDQQHDPLVAQLIPKYRQVDVVDDDMNWIEVSDNEGITDFCDREDDDDDH